MALRLAEPIGEIVRHAEQEARDTRSRMIEAEHLLLAMSGQHGSEARNVLSSVGLDRDGIKVALDREFRQSLATAGVMLSPSKLPLPNENPGHHPQLATSGKLALERGLRAAGKREIRPGHLLLGVLAAQVGTVPRALALMGVDQSDLAARIVQALVRNQS